MAIRKSLQLLLVESNPEDEQLICEALIEIDEGSHWRLWHSCELVHVEALSDALACLGCATFDALLVDLELPDGDSLLDSFHRLHAAARDAAIVVLIDERDEDLASRLLREGAQDVLLKSRLECEPLARSLRYAVERQRRASALESISVFDELTGLCNARGFSIFAEHDMQLARRTGSPFALALLDVSGFPAHPGLKHRDDRDLLIIRASELLRTIFGESAVVGRLGDCRFGVFTIESSETGIERLANAFEAELCAMWGHHPRFPLSIRTGSSTFSPDRGDDLDELLQQAQQRLTPKTAMLAV